jgi:hypothetical protein
VVVLAAIAYLALAIVWLGGDVLRAPELFARGSMHATSPEGLSTAAAYLRERGRDVSPLTRELRPDAVDPGSVVFRVHPPAAKALLSPEDEAWVRAGGRLIVATRERQGPLAVATRAPAPVRKTFPLWPHVRMLAPAEPRVFRAGLPAGARTLLAQADEAVLAQIDLGAGEFLLLACPDVLENARLAQGDHAALLEALAGPPSRPVRFDERVHGQVSDPGLVDLLLGLRLGPTLVLMALAGVVALVRNRARLGPAEDDHEETRQDAVDLVESLARLYDRALRPAEALRLYQDGLRRATAVRLGLAGASLERRVSELTHDVALPEAAEKITPAAFESTLAGLNRAYDRMEDHARSR